MASSRRSYIHWPPPGSGRALLLLASWALAALTPPALAQRPDRDAELSRHVTTVRTQIEDVTVDPARREEMVLELAATLDRAAKEEVDAENCRRRWAEAIDLLDRFARANPDRPMTRQLRFQAGVFRWAQARTWCAAAQFEPQDPKLHEPAVTLLDDAIERLRSANSIGDRSALGDNLRFRLAQALADRAELEATGSGGR